MVIFFFIIILWSVLHIGYLIYDGLTDELAIVDVAVILGNTVNPDGKPSRRLRGRLDEAIDLYKKGYFSNIIVSGAKGREGYVESEVMGLYLNEHGIPEHSIILDHNGRNTMETAINTKRIMAQHQWKSAMIITQAYHITRTKLAFRRVGIKPVYAAHARFFELRDLILPVTYQDDVLIFAEVDIIGKDIDAIEHQEVLSVLGAEDPGDRLSLRCDLIDEIQILRVVGIEFTNTALRIPIDTPHIHSKTARLDPLETIFRIEIQDRLISEEVDEVIIILISFQYHIHQRRR